MMSNTKISRTAQQADKCEIEVCGTWPHEAQADDIQAPRGQVVHILLAEGQKRVEVVLDGQIGGRLVHHIDAVEDSLATV